MLSTKFALPCADCYTRLRSAHIRKDTDRIWECCHNCLETRPKSALIYLYLLLNGECMELWASTVIDTLIWDIQVYPSQLYSKVTGEKRQILNIDF